MKFLVDAQLPRRDAGWFAAAGCDALHTLDLPDGNRTTDQQVIEAADREQRAVVTKDADFVDSHVLYARPARLLLISTGNISNRELETLMVPLIPVIVQEFQAHSFLESGEVALSFVDERGRARQQVRPSHARRPGAGRRTESRRLDTGTWAGHTRIR